jgi:hypothetical protein
VAADDFQNFGTFRRRLADIVYHLLIKVWPAFVAQDEKRAGPITRKNLAEAMARENELVHLWCASQRRFVTAAVVT